MERLVPPARREQARLSARLDASPLTDETADAVDAGRVATAAASGQRRPAAGWAGALQLEGMATQDLAAVEYANLLACFDAEPALAGDVLDDLPDVLRGLHAELCRGLVDPEVAGALRATVQAVHDGAQGRVLYNPPPPGAVAGHLAELAGWVRRRGRAEHPLVVAGTINERLLEWQPFEAGNGRVARAAARVVLRATGVDPHGVAVPERWLAADPGGYFAEVAATIRRRGDLRRWLERSSEAVVAALGAAADAVRGEQPAVPQRGRAVVGALAAGETLTVADYAGRAGVGLDDARTDLRALARAGLLQVEPGTRGLRYRRQG